LVPFFGVIRLPEIGPAEVQIFIAEKSKRFAPWTVHQLLSLLSKIFGTAVKWGYLQSNPARMVEAPALINTRERLTLTPEQARSLLGELSEPYRTMVLLALLSGLRRGEIFGLRWKYVDFAGCSITVAECAYDGRVAPPKTRASKRKVFLDNVVMAALLRLRPKSSQPDDFVFHSERRTPLNPNNLRNRVLAPACKRAKIPPIGWHNLRYTYATWANPTGESIKALQAQMGHTNPNLTVGVYTQPQPEAQKQLASKIARVLLPIAPKSDSEKEGAGVLIQ
jgi:integrase